MTKRKNPAARLGLLLLLFGALEESLEEPCCVLADCASTAAYSPAVPMARIPGTYWHGLLNFGFHDGGGGCFGGGCFGCHDDLRDNVMSVLTRNIKLRRTR